MANYLNHDIDLDLSKLHGDSDLKLLLLETMAKLIVVIEDLNRFMVERSSESQSPTPPVTAVSSLGIQYFTDGILSACHSEERVMMFTIAARTSTLRLALPLPS